MWETVHGGCPYMRLGRTNRSQKTLLDGACFEVSCGSRRISRIHNIESADVGCWKFGLRGYNSA